MTAFIIVWRGMKSIDCAFFLCDSRLSTFFPISSGGGFATNLSADLGGRAGIVVCAESILQPETVELNAGEASGNVATAEPS